MDNIFLSPESTFRISIKTKIVKRGAFEVPSFDIEDDGPYELRTATGREYAAIQQAGARQDADAAFSLLPGFVVAGIADGIKGTERAAIFDSLHPDVVWSLLTEVAKRSRQTDLNRGK